jgi:predicted TIM-barrel fold metal-dependent hydrolase
MHIHFGAPKDEESGCYWSKDFEKTAAYYAMLLMTKSFCRKVNIERVKKHLLGKINSSKNVQKSVLLAMDEAYDENGIVQQKKTHLHVPNRYLVKLAEENEQVLVGASVHPYRDDWREELDFCLANKAVLCKWIPSSQLINPEHPKCAPFYHKLVDHKLPLLCHSGPEYSIPTSSKAYNKYNNPKYLRKALEQGVVVIVAHCALPYFYLLDKPDYYDDWHDFLKLVQEAEKSGRNLYADLSAITGPLRLPFIDDIIKKLPAKRLLFGSDYPVPLSGLSYHKPINIWAWFKFLFKIISINNPLDKNYKILKGMGFNDQVFTNASKLFSSILYPSA